MKYLFVVLLGLLLWGDVAAQKIDSFMGVPWDAPPDSMRTRMADVSGIKVKSDSTVGRITALVYRDGEFAGYPVRKWVIIYFDNQFVGATVDLAHGDGSTSGLQQYRSIIPQLIDKYGNPSRSYKETQLPGYSRLWDDIDVISTILYGRVLRGDPNDLSVKQLRTPLALYHVWRSTHGKEQRELRCECPAFGVKLSYNDVARMKIVEREMQKLQGKSARNKSDDL